MSDNFTRQAPCPRCLALPEVISGEYDAGMVYQSVSVFTPHWEVGPEEFSFGDWSECDACNTHPIGRHPAWTKEEVAQLEASA